MTAEATGPPIFLICVARSGSTLLARLLDAHPQLACPSETSLDQPFAEIEYTSRMAAQDQHEGFALTDQIIRYFADQTLGAYARRRGKMRWCDKSLTVVDNLDRISRAFPDALFICLYREVTDTIASGLESSPWGWSQYGYQPYVRKNSDNLIEALATYWADKVEAELGFEKANPDQCHRLLYEDLVTAPTKVLSRLFSFLELPWDEAIMEHEGIFGRRKVEWAGDHKIRYSQAFDVSSIGRGWNMPMDIVQKPVRDRIARLSRALGYPRPGEDPPSTMNALRTRFGRLKDVPAVSALMKRRIDAVSPLFAERAAPRLADGSWTGGRVKLVGAVRLVLADIIADGAGEWVIDFPAGQVKGPGQPAASTVLTDSETLLNIANGTLNPGLALRRGKLQVWSDRTSSPERLLDRLDAIVGLVLPRDQS